MSHIRSRPARLATAIATAAAVFAGACVATTGAYAAPLDELPEGALQLQYEFESADVQSGTVKDLSGNDRDGTIVNPAAVSWVDGARTGSRALDLPGGASTSTTAPYISIPRGLFANMSAATISSWVNWDGGADFQWVYGLGANNNRSIFYTPSFNDGAARSSIKPVNGNQEVGVSSPGKLATDRWINVVTVVDEQTISYFVDGVKVGSKPAALDLDAVMHATTGTTSGFLGKPFWGGHPFFDGSIDDFRVYNVALTDAQVAALSATDATVVSIPSDPITIRTTVGQAPSLPGTVAAVYSDGHTRGAVVDWATIDLAAYTTRNSFTVEGAVTGTDLTVTADVTVTLPGEMTIDLATNTGEFHGGASGTLYGIYSEGLPSRNLIEGVQLRSVATKAQDGPQHPGADALEILPSVVEASNGDVYIYMTDIHRGFPYQWEGDTPLAKMDTYMDKLALQVDQVLSMPEEYQNIVFMPYNEPEGNMFGTGTWSYNGISWLNNPTDFLAAWDRAYRMIKQKMPDARIGGPNTSVLYAQVRGFMQHALRENTVPDVIAWHELSNPATVRSSVDRFRSWEDELYPGTPLEGRHLPINITEYAYNYHTSVPGQMIQWVAAIEEKKVDADIAYWNIDGNMSDSAVQANRGNGQWWLLNSYGQLTGHTVEVTPPAPNQSYTLQGVATLDDDRSLAKAIVGGAAGKAPIVWENVPTETFGGTVHVSIKEIPWTGQLGDSAQPETVADLNVELSDRDVVLHFGEGDLPPLKASSAYQISLTPGENAADTDNPAPYLWKQSFEAEDAAYTGTPRFRNGPEGSPNQVQKFFTSGGFNIGGLRTDSSLALDFKVTVPQAGAYDLSLFANSLNTFAAVLDQGPTNVFVRVNGAAEQELFLPLGYKWVVWDQTKTKVELAAGENTITVAAQNLDGSKSTKGDALLDKIDVSLANPDAATSVYEAEYATLDGASARFDRSGVSGSGAVTAGADQAVTFWVYSRDDAASVLNIDTVEGTGGSLWVNDVEMGAVSEISGKAVFLKGGINKITVQGSTSGLALDRLRVTPAADHIESDRYQAEDATLAGTARIAELTLADGGKAVIDVGGDPGNDNTITFDGVKVDQAGTYALTVRYSNQEQSPATHYNPDPLARHAEIQVNGGTTKRGWFPHSFHADNFWELTIPVELAAGTNTIRFSSQELPNFNSTELLSASAPELLRSKYAPNIDRIRVTALK